MRKAAVVCAAIWAAVGIKGGATMQVQTRPAYAVSRTAWTQETAAFRDALNKLPAATQAAIWQKKIRRCLERIALTPSERSAVERGLALAVESKYKATVAEGMDQKEKDRGVWSEIELILGQSRFREIFVSLPRREILEVGPVPAVANSAGQEVDLYTRAYMRLADKEKVAIWQAHVRKCADTVALTRIERDAVEGVAVFLGDHIDAPPLVSTAVSEAHRPFWDSIERVLGRERFAGIFLQIPRDEILRQTGFPLRDSLK
ncbi:MAG: hypothetical protein AB1806_06535 [Acidobacteriota bacterium]